MPPPIYFISHGGPNIMFETDHPAYTSLSRLGREITSHLTPASPKIKGILVLSAHWQSSARDKLYVSSPNETESEDNEEGLGLIYDFYGFPQEYYKEKYPYKSSRELAGEVCEVLGEKGVACERERRGLDHGVWVGFKCMFNPKTNPIPTSIPILQLSLYHNENAPLHYSLGKALAPLREQGYLIICSGMAVHNLRDLRFTFGTSKVMDYVHSFDEALREAVVDTEPGEERRVAMEKLLTRSDARKAHPTFEHLLPIYVAVGAAEKEKAERVWTLGEMSMSWAQFRFGNW